MNKSTDITLTNARAELKALGYTISHRDGEYRVAPTVRCDARGITAKVAEDRAYYTNDLEDALNTGRHMFAHEYGKATYAESLEHAKGNALRFSAIVSSTGDRLPPSRVRCVSCAEEHQSESDEGIRIRTSGMCQRCEESYVDEDAASDARAQNSTPAQHTISCNKCSQIHRPNELCPVEHGDAKRPRFQKPAYRAFVESRGAAQVLLARITRKLNEVDAPAANWAYVGTMQEVLKQLESIDTSMTSLV